MSLSNISFSEGDEARGQDLEYLRTYKAWTAISTNLVNWTLEITIKFCGAAQAFRVGA